MPMIQLSKPDIKWEGIDAGPNGLFKAILFDSTAECGAGQRAYQL